MLLRILKETFLRRKKRVLLAVMAVVLGSSLVAALFSISADIAERMSQEMRSYGANILMTPKSENLQVDIGGVSLSPSVSQDYLIDEGELPKLKTIFWRNNILGFAPYLSSLATVEGTGTQVVLTGTWFDKELTLPQGARLTTGLGTQEAVDEGQSFRTGVRAISPWWKVQGQWVEDDDTSGAIVGTALAEGLDLKLGDKFTLSHKDSALPLQVAGIVSTGGYEDNQVFVALPAAQRLLGAKGVNRVLVSALTLPTEKLAPDIRNKRPEEMTPAEYEKWYCSPVIEAVIKQIEEAFPDTEARAVRQISEAEGAFVSKMQLLVLLVTAVALLASALGVMTTMTTMVLERRGEIGLMKAIGAENGQIVFIFLVEAGLIGLLGGGVGYLVGLGLARLISQGVFGTTVSPGIEALPVTLLLALGVALLGSALPVSRAVREAPVLLLRGN